MRPYPPRLLRRLPVRLALRALIAGTRPIPQEFRQEVAPHRAGETPWPAELQESRVQAETGGRWAAGEVGAGTSDSSGQPRFAGRGWAGVRTAHGGHPFAGECDVLRNGFACAGVATEASLRPGAIHLGRKLR